MVASVDATLDNWAVGNHADLLGEILDVMVCRRAVDKQHGGETLDAPWMQHIVTRPLNIQFVFPSHEGKRAYEAKPALTKGDIISSMQLNYEVTNYFSQKISQAMQHATKFNRSLWAYVFSRCSGRGFVDLAAASGLKGASVKEILSWAWDELDDPAEIFSKNFQPQSVFRNVIKEQSKSEFLESLPDPKKYMMTIVPARVRVKDDKNKWRSKRAVMKDVRAIKGNGPFLGKHMWRIYNGFHKSNMPDDFSYADTGPGARCFLLLGADLPQRFGISASSQCACDTFNKHLQRFTAELDDLLRQRVARARTDQERHWYAAVQSELLSCPEAVQFMCCEGIKVLRYLITRDERYLRTSAAAPDEEDDEE